MFIIALAMLSAQAQDLGDVEPLYPGAARWNDYLANDGASVLDASGASCDPTEPSGYDSCLHGGELRSVEVLVAGSCAGVSASDALGAFDWVCDDSTGAVRVVSVGLTDGAKLSDLIDFDARRWQANHVVVDAPGGPYATTDAGWWDNPVILRNEGLGDDVAAGPAVAGAIHLMASNSEPYSIDGVSNVALVMRPGSKWRADGDDLLHVTNADFVWIELAADADVGDSLVALSEVGFAVFDHVDLVQSLTIVSVIGVNSSVFRNVTMRGGNTGFHLVGSTGLAVHGVTIESSNEGVAIEASSGVELVDVALSDVDGIGISVLDSDDVVLRDIFVDRSESVGVEVQRSPDLVIDGMVVTRAEDRCVYLDEADGAFVTDLEVASCASDGVRVATSTGVRMHGVRTSMNQSQGLQLDAVDDSIVTEVVAAYNDEHGVVVEQGTDLSIGAVTAFDGRDGSGLAVDSSANVVVWGVMAFGNAENGLEFDGNRNLVVLGSSAMRNGQSDSTFGFDFDRNESEVLLSNVVATLNHGGVGLDECGGTVRMVDGAVADNHRVGFELQDTDPDLQGVLKSGGHVWGDCYCNDRDSIPCVPCGTDSAVVVSGAGAGDAFVGPVSGDAVNRTVTPDGTSAAVDVTDWVAFEHPYRGWASPLDPLEVFTFEDGAMPPELSFDPVAPWTIDPTVSNPLGDGTHSLSIALPAGVSTCVSVSASHSTSGEMVAAMLSASPGGDGRIELQAPGDFSDFGIGPPWEFHGIHYSDPPNVRICVFNDASGPLLAWFDDLMFLDALQCVGDETCQMFDFALTAADTVLRDQNPIPTGDDLLTHNFGSCSSPDWPFHEDCVDEGEAWLSNVPVKLLRYAVELHDDGVGNDNGLCESGETCLHTPNLGSYQGHGELVDLGFVDGAITGVTLLGYADNGY